MSVAPDHIDRLLRHPGLWRGGEQAATETIATGFDALDRCLPGGGWPTGALTELLPAAEGIGELALLMPALVHLSHAGYRGRRRIAWIAPPYIPYAPALSAHGLDLSQLTVIRPGPADTPWATEQSLRAGVFAAVLAWPGSVDARGLRRLQLAAEAGRALAAVLRPPRTAAQPSPAALRLALAAHCDGLSLHLLKCRGRFKGRDRLTLVSRPLSSQHSSGRIFTAHGVASPRHRTGYDSSAHLASDKTTHPISTTSSGDGTPGPDAAILATPPTRAGAQAGIT